MRIILILTLASKWHLIHISQRIIHPLHLFKYLQRLLCLLRILLYDALVAAGIPPLGFEFEGWYHKLPPILTIPQKTKLAPLFRLLPVRSRTHRHLLLYHWVHKSFRYRRHTLVQNPAPVGWIYAPQTEIIFCEIFSGRSGSTTINGATVLALWRNFFEILFGFWVYGFGGGAWWRGSFVSGAIEVGLQPPVILPLQPYLPLQITILRKLRSAPLTRQQLIRPRQAHCTNSRNVSRNTTLWAPRSCVRRQNWLHHILSAVALLCCGARSSSILLHRARPHLNPSPPHIEPQSLSLGISFQIRRLLRADFVGFRLRRQAWRASLLRSWLQLLGVNWIRYGVDGLRSLPTLPHLSGLIHAFTYFYDWCFLQVLYHLLNYIPLLKPPLAISSAVVYSRRRNFRTPKGHFFAIGQGAVGGAVLLIGLVMLLPASKKLLAPPHGISLQPERYLLPVLLLAHATWGQQVILVSVCYDCVVCWALQIAGACSGVHKFALLVLGIEDHVEGRRVDALPTRIRNLRLLPKRYLLPPLIHSSTLHHQLLSLANQFLELLLQLFPVTEPGSLAFPILIFPRKRFFLIYRLF